MDTTFQNLCHLTASWVCLHWVSQPLASVRPQPWLIHKCWGSSSQCRRLQDLALSLVPVPVTSFMPTWLELFLASLLCAWLGSDTLQLLPTKLYSERKNLWVSSLQTFLMYSKCSVHCQRYVTVLLLGCPNVLQCKLLTVWAMSAWIMPRDGWTQLTHCHFISPDSSSWSWTWLSVDSVFLTIFSVPWSQTLLCQRNLLCEQSAQRQTGLTENAPLAFTYYDLGPLSK